jgi:small GTP-binding protein
MIDLPGIIEGAKDGRGRGRQVIAVAKTCHLIFIVLDVNKPLTDKRVIEAELEGFGIRINKSPPNITFKKKDKGGLNITSTVPLTHIDTDEIRAVMNEWVFFFWCGLWHKGRSMLTAATGTRLARPISPSGATPPSTT